MILVIKLSGKVLEEDKLRAQLCRQIAQLAQDDHQLVVVHGGGKQLTDWSKRVEIPIVQHQGRRVTDEATLELATMVFSAINRELVADLVAVGLSAIGISAFDGRLTSCRKRPPLSVSGSEPIDFGLVGEIEAIDISLLEKFWENGSVPIVSCLGADTEGQILNINADTLAAELAVELKAARLISVSDVEGIYLDINDASSCISELSRTEIQALLSEGRLTNGMVPKVQTALKVLEGGVGEVQIVSGLKEKALLDALEGKAGTRLTADN
jgi:acetylglutamate kinase